MLLENKYPVVGLTLRHDRLDNFWFVLLHELGHIILHRNAGLADGFFDEEKASSTKQVEVEADNFARNAFVPDELWNASLVRFTNDETQVVKFAERLKIHPSIVAGKLRRERNYTLFNSLIGRDKVRAMLSTNSVVVGGYYDD
jgi:HTH-type transcriptional regulator / antitoxin HigA